jgi:hypothetical protein
MKTSEIGEKLCFVTRLSRPSSIDARKGNYYKEVDALSFTLYVFQRKAIWLSAWQKVGRLNDWLGIFKKSAL